MFGPTIPHSIQSPASTSYLEHICTSWFGHVCPSRICISCIRTPRTCTSCLEHVSTFDPDHICISPFPHTGWTIVKSSSGVHDKTRSKVIHKCNLCDLIHSMYIAISHRHCPFRRDWHRKEFCHQSYRGGYRRKGFCRCRWVYNGIDKIWHSRWQRIIHCLWHRWSWRTSDGRQWFFWRHREGV